MCGYCWENAIPGQASAEELRQGVPVLTRKFPGLFFAHDCPEYECSPNVCLYDAIVHLNDAHNWTYLQIADWLETLPINQEI